MIRLAGVVSTALAQGVLERLLGEINVVATATNDRRAVFIDVRVERAPPDVSGA